MTAGPRIAIDAMGGDSGPAAMIAGASRALRRDPSLRVRHLRRRAARSRPSSQRHGDLRATRHASSIRPKRSPPSEKPSQAIRRAGTTSMGMAINAVKDGKADAALSGRQHRRADGHVQARAAHHAGDRPAGARRAAADARRHRRHHARPRRQHRVRRAEPRPVRGDGRGLCPDRARDRQAAGETAQHRHRGTEGHRRAQGGRGAAARGRLSAVAVRRLHRGRPAVARRGRRRRHRRLFRQYRAEDRRRHRALRHRPAAPGVQELAAVQGRLRAVAAGAEPAQGPPRPQQPQRRGLPRAQRAGREEPRQRQPQGRRQRHRRRGEHGPQRHHPARSATTSTISAPTPSPTRRRNEPAARSILGAGSALPKRRVTNAELAETVDTSDAVDRRAHRNPQPLHRRRGRNHRDPRHRRRAQGAGAAPGSTPRTST